jgi:quercetin dioxygenase-like cupin family protein
MNDDKIEPWEDRFGDLNEGNARRRLEAEGFSVIRYDYPPGTVFGDHKHPVDKKDAVVSGCLLIRAEGREFFLHPGDALPVPAGTVHSAEVIGNETVISLDGTRY